MNTTITDYEFMNYTEVVNDLLHKLHEKDRQLLESLKLTEFLETQQEYFPPHPQFLLFVASTKSSYLRTRCYTTRTFA
jgi:hypothetical protein